MASVCSRVTIFDLVTPESIEPFNHDLPVNDAEQNLYQKTQGNVICVCETMILACLLFSYAYKASCMDQLMTAFNCAGCVNYAE